MVKYSLLFLLLLVTTTYAQIGPDGTGTVNGYFIGPDANLAGAYLRGANLSGANLSGANLRSADLRYANLTGANLSNADLSYAGLSDANLSYAGLSDANLSGADLYYADLSGANLRNANLTNADLYGTMWSNVSSQSDYDAVVAERDAALTAKASAEAERDARPTQVAYDTVVAERDAKLTLDEVKDLRAGSTMIAVAEGQATLSMEVEKSDDLGIWTTSGTASVQMNVQPGEDKKFFRFKMTE